MRSNRLPSLVFVTIRRGFLNASTAASTISSVTSIGARRVRSAVRHPVRKSSCASSSPGAYSSASACASASRSLSSLIALSLQFFANVLLYLKQRSHRVPHGNGSQVVRVLRVVGGDVHRSDCHRHVNLPGLKVFVPAHVNLNRRLQGTVRAGNKPEVPVLYRIEFDRLSGL